MKELKILSFDVGIVNIGHCAMVRHENQEVNILNWGLINLTSNTRVHRKCSGKLKSGKVCGKKALFHQVSPTGETSYCKTHLKQGANTWPVARVEKYFRPADSGCKCQQVNTKGDVCERIAKQYCRYTKKTYCQTHYRALTKKLVNQFQPKRITNKSVKKTATGDFQLELLSRLDELTRQLSHYPIDEVIIENQPGLKAGKMKSIASTIFVYYMMRGMHDKTHGLNLTRVRFIAACNKLKLNNKNTLEVFKNSDKKKKYKLTKALSVKYTIQMLLAKDKKSHYVKFLELFPKKDDLCDAYLQGVYYLLFLAN